MIVHRSGRDSSRTGLPRPPLCRLVSPTARSPLFQLVRRPTPAQLLVDAEDRHQARKSASTSSGSDPSASERHRERAAKRNRERQHRYDLVVTRAVNALNGSIEMSAQYVAMLNLGHPIQWCSVEATSMYTREVMAMAEKVLPAKRPPPVGRGTRSVEEDARRGGLEADGLVYRGEPDAADLNAVDDTADGATELDAGYDDGTEDGGADYDEVEEEKDDGAGLGQSRRRAVGAGREAHEEGVPMEGVAQFGGGLDDAPAGGAERPPLRRASDYPEEESVAGDGMSVDGDDDEAEVQQEEMSAAARWSSSLGACLFDVDGEEAGEAGEGEEGGEEEEETVEHEGEEDALSVEDEDTAGEGGEEESTGVMDLDEDCGETDTTDLDASHASRYISAASIWDIQSLYDRGCL